MKQIIPLAFLGLFIACNDSENEKDIEHLIDSLNAISQTSSLYNDDLGITKTDSQNLRLNTTIKPLKLNSHYRIRKNNFIIF